MGVADLELNRKTRSVFVRHWIDLGHISIRSVNGRIRVRGHLKRVFGHQEALTPIVLSNIFGEIKRATGAKYVTPALENWTFASGTWQEVGEKSEREGKKPLSRYARDESTGTYAIDDE